MSVAEFFKRNRAVAGFSNPARSVYQTVRELLENALDATENYGILPDIKLNVRKLGKIAGKDLLEIECQDNGIGVPPTHVPKAFAQVLYGSKYINRQSRGLFGMGVKMAVIYAQITTGEPITVVTSPKNGDGTVYTFQLKINMKENKPVVVSRSKAKGNGWHGTKVKLRIAGDWGRARRYVVEYVKRTAVITPFANIYFRYPEDGKYSILRFGRTTEKMPPPPQVKKPHPYGVDFEVFKDMLSSAPKNMKVYRFLASRFDRVGDVTAVKLLKSVGISQRKTVGGLTKADIKKLWEALQTFKWPRPSAEGLSPLGAKLIEVGLRRVFSPEFVAAVQRPPSSHGGYAFIVEAGAAWGGNIPVSDKITILRFLNKIPAIYDEGDCGITKVVQSIDLSNYKLQPPQPLVILVHVVSTKIPFKGLGKEALADVPELQHEVELAVRESLRKIARCISKKRREEEERRRKAEILKYSDMISASVSYLAGVDSRVVKLSLEKLVAGERHGN